MLYNLPIQSTTKGTVTVQREPVDATSWAYMKLLRENNGTKRMYDVNPYAEVYLFRDNVYGILTESADGMGDPWSYLIVGPESAMLIDTGFGIGDLKGLANELSRNKPLIVVNTHCHFDHAYGNCQFERCYCHELEVEVMESKQDSHIWDYLSDKNGGGVWFDFDRADIVPFKRYEIIGLPDGHTFDLGGGHEIELVWLPGHSAGHAGFLDKASRILFAGDAIIGMRVGMGRGAENTTIAAYRNELVKLSRRVSEFDHIFPGHFALELESHVVFDLIETCDAIIANPTSYDEAIERHGRMALLKGVKNLGTIAYSQEKVGADLSLRPALEPRPVTESNSTIPSRLKSNKIKVREPIDARCWAFMREIRAHHAGKRSYAINPYAEVYRLRENLYGILTEHLAGSGDVWSYLILGPERAMLIDTGFGVGDLKSLVNRITGGMPLIVANTHAHMDHASGNCQFARVYCHKYSVPQLKSMRRPDWWDQLFGDDGKPIWTDFDRHDIVPFAEYEIAGCSDGHIFDLGEGYVVEMIWTAGHTPGHCMYLDHASRLLIAGDDAISMRVLIRDPSPDDPFGQYATVTTFARQMTKLAARADEYDHVFPGHFCHDLGSEVISEIARVAGEIVSDPQRYSYCETVQTPTSSSTRFYRFVPGLGTLAYTEGAI